MATIDQAKQEFWRSPGGLMPTTDANTEPAAICRAAFMAANPEARLFQNHAPTAAQVAATAFMHGNPELRVFLTHAGSVEATAEAGVIVHCPVLQSQ